MFIISKVYDLLIENYNELLQIAKHRRMLP